MIEGRDLYDPERPLEWFEALYQKAGGNMEEIPWGDGAPNPNLVIWCEREGHPRAGERVLVVGCGLGDDAEYLASRGAHVTAFDLSATAIAWCQKRWSGSSVQYVQANLLDAKWGESFDLVVEIYTLQAMPPEVRAQAYAKLAAAVKGHLLVICRGRDETDDPGGLPWRLTKAELVDGFNGLELAAFEDIQDPVKVGTRRFRAVWKQR
jgi:SAM-dependent methyltransferase